MAIDVAQALKDDTFAGVAADYLTAERDEKRAEEELDRARQNSERTTARAAAALKTLQQEKWLLGKQTRTAVIDGYVVTLFQHPGTDALRVVVTEAEGPLGSRRR